MEEVRMSSIRTPIWLALAACVVATPVTTSFAQEGTKLSGLQEWIDKP